MHARSFFLKTHAAIEFLKFTGKDTSGNNLERDLFLKLHNSSELIQLQADSLMYYHIYADLVMLSKSSDLNLSAYSMNCHYLELHSFLCAVLSNPAIVFNQDYRVFSSEERIYESNAKVNHRLKSPAVYEKLFNNIELDCEYLLAILARGASKMNEKLWSYAADQLPGGRYWEPDKQIKDILLKLKPSNDVCEFVLGLNDYLCIAIPMHQAARSNLIQLKKNKTLKWLSSLPSDEQKSIVDLAVKRRRCVSKECQEEEKIRRLEQRQKKMLKENTKRIYER